MLVAADGVVAACTGVRLPLHYQHELSSLYRVKLHISNADLLLFFPVQRCACPVLQPGAAAECSPSFTRLLLPFMSLFWFF